MNPLLFISISSPPGSSTEGGFRHHLAYLRYVYIERAGYFPNLVSPSGRRGEEELVILSSAQCRFKKILCIIGDMLRILAGYGNLTQMKPRSRSLLYGYALEVEEESVAHVYHRSNRSAERKPSAQRKPRPRTFVSPDQIRVFIRRLPVGEKSQSEG